MAMPISEIERPRETAAPPGAPQDQLAAPSVSLPLNVIRLAFLALLLYGAGVLLYPFSSVILWSVALSVSLYPVYDWIAFRLNGRRRIAAVIVTVLTLLVLTIPAAWIAITVAESTRQIYEQIDFSSVAVLSPPESIKSWPLFGDDLYRLWSYAASNVGDLLVKLGPQLKSLAGTFVRVGAGAGLGTVSFLLAIIVMGFLLPASPSVLKYVRGFARKLDPVRGENFVVIAGSTIRAVAKGVVGISVLQAIFASIGFIAGGIPQASLLTFAVFLFGIIQIGPSIVILPVIVWAWTFMDTGPAIVFTIYMLAVNTLDNVLKPFLMGRGSEAPMLTVLVGVIGGALAFGISGVFLGPIVLTVVWTLFRTWIDEPDPA
jgi:predicted PurR-regulated permease PerM